MKKPKKTLILDLSYEGSRIEFINELSSLIQKAVAIISAEIIFVTMYSTFLEKDTIQDKVSFLGGDITITQEYHPYELSTSKREQLIQNINEQVEKKYKEYIEKKNKKSPETTIQHEEKSNLSFPIDTESAYYIRKVLFLEENTIITQEHLNMLTEIDISLFDKSTKFYINDMDLNWINHCPNLRSLTISIHEASQVSKIKAIKDLPNLEYFKIKRELINKKLSQLSYGVPFDENNFSFLFNSHKLKVLNVDSSIFAISGNFLSKINTPFDLVLNNYHSYSTQIDLNNIGSCKSITFDGSEDSGPYDIATAMSKEDFQKLVSKQIPMYFKINRPDQVLTYTLKELEPKVNEIYEQIDQEYLNIGITNNDDDKIKTQKIITYVITKLEYSTKINQLVKDETKSEELDQLYSSLCYNGGLLSSAFNENGEVICGTYASLTNVLLTKAGVKSYILCSPGHAWNLVEVNGYFYFVDSTFIDHNKIDLDKILEPPINEGLHESFNMPIFEDVYGNVDYNFEPQISKMLNSYEVKYRDTIYGLNQATYFTLLLSLGFAISTGITRKKLYDIYDEHSEKNNKTRN